MEKKNILITGASGSVGFDTFKIFFSNIDDFNIRVFLRESRKNKKLFKGYKDKIEIIWGDLKDFGSIQKALVNQDIIVHIAGVIPPLADEEIDYTYEINVEGTKKILKAIKFQKSKTKIIYTSSIAIYGDRLEDPMIKKIYNVNPNDFYAKTKLKAEELIKESNIEYLIFRLSYCTNIRTFKIKPLMFEVPLDTCLEIIDTRDKYLMELQTLMVLF
jgi:nucleoside-diphosphate-sugar epimerase